jgi:hypothetical protein
MSSLHKETLKMPGLVLNCFLLFGFWGQQFLTLSLRKKVLFFEFELNVHFYGPINMHNFIVRARKFTEQRKKVKIILYKV